MKVREIREILRAMEATGASELTLETPDYKIQIKRGPAEVPVPGVATPPVPPPPPAEAAPPPPPPAPKEAPAEPAKEEAAPEEAGDDCPNCVTVKAPIVGTFYRRPAPDAEPYVKEGDRVEKGQVLCIIEAMKLFNEIESEVSGIVRKILVEDGAPVEYGQPLFLIEPT